MIPEFKKKPILKQVYQNLAKFQVIPRSLKSQVSSERNVERMLLYHIKCSNTLDLIV